MSACLGEESRLIPPISGKSDVTDDLSFPFLPYGWGGHFSPNVCWPYLYNLEVRKQFSLNFPTLKYLFYLF